jgi:hypothetical protein
MRPLTAEAPGLNSEMDARRSDRRPRSRLKFFLLVFAFSDPFWLIGAVIDVQLLPGLPLSALRAFCPLIAALVLVHREHGTAGIVALLKPAFDFRRIPRKRWYVPIVALMPGVSVLVYGRFPARHFARHSGLGGDHGSVGSPRYGCSASRLSALADQAIQGTRASKSTSGYCVDGPSRSSTLWPNKWRSKNANV